jgi:hypothetical protein
MNYYLQNRACVGTCQLGTSTRFNLEGSLNAVRGMSHVELGDDSVSELFSVDFPIPLSRSR